MKIIVWRTKNHSITFKCNWLEYKIIKKLFETKRMKIVKDDCITGRKIDCVTTDELDYFDWKKALKGDKGGENA